MKKYSIIFVLLLSQINIVLPGDNTTIPFTSWSFTTSSLSEDMTANNCSMQLYTTILDLEKSHYLSSSNKTSYINTLLQLQGLVLGVDLNDDDTLMMAVYKSWNDMVINTTWITDQNQSTLVIANAAGIGSNANVSTSTVSADLNTQISNLSSQITDLNNQISNLKAEQAQKNADLLQARQDQLTAFEDADPFLRGRLGIITNNSTVAYQLLDSSGNVLDTILAGGSSSRQFILSDYADDNQGTIFTLVPYDATTKVQEGTDEAMLNGGTLVILCNNTGANIPGNAYGYEGTVSISRVYPDEATRAHMINIDDLIEENQYWEVDFSIGELPAASAFTYPLVSQIQTVTLDVDTLATDMTKTFPDLLDVAMDTTTVISETNSDADSYPSFDSDDALTLWSDLAAQG